MATSGAATATHRRKNRASSTAMTTVVSGDSFSRSVCIWSMAATRVNGTPAYSCVTSTPRSAAPRSAAPTRRRTSPAGPTTSS